MISNLFELKYVLNKELLKVLIGKVDAQLLKAAHTQSINQSINQSIYFVTHKHYSQNNVIKQNIHIMCDG